MLAVHLRPATEADYPFLATALYAAEGGEAGRSTYEVLFGLTVAETHALLVRAFQEELDDCELSAAAFWVAEVGGQPAATCAAWVEQPGLGSSTSLKAQALPYLLGLERWRAAEPLLRALAAVAIPRTEGALQLEAFYTAAAFRGRGLAAQLIAAQRERFPQARRAEIQLAAHNTAAQAAYAKAGFRPDAHTQNANPLVAEVLGGPGKVRLCAVWE